jgi:hypothetical protein
MTSARHSKTLSMDQRWAEVLIDNLRTALWIACRGGAIDIADAERIDRELKRVAQLPPSLPEEVDHGTRH